MKKFLFLLILFFTFPVFATSKDVIDYIQYDTDNPTGTYKGDEIELGGYNGKFDVKTRYNGRLSLIEFYLSSDYFDFKTNTTYTITLSMATNDWRNNFMGPQVIKANLNGSLQNTNGSLSVSNFQFVSRKQIKFNFKTNSSLSPYLFFRLYSVDYASTNTTAFTGDNNWNLSSIVITDSSSSGSSGSGSSGSGSSGSGSTSSTLTCSNGLVLNSLKFSNSSVNTNNYYLNTSGTKVSDSNYGIIEFISISPDTSYLLNKSNNTDTSPSYCLYTSYDSIIGCYSYNSQSNITFNSGNAKYISLSLRYGQTITMSNCASSLDNQNQNTQQIIDNQNQNTSNIIENNNDNTQQIIDNQNQNAQQTQQTIKDELNTCKDLTPTQLNSFNGLITAPTTFPNNLRLEPSSSYLVYVYEVKKLDEDYTFVFNNYNRLRVGASDTLYTEITANRLITKLLVDDSPSISSTYTIHTNYKYLYFYLSSNTSQNGSITFQPKEECKNKLDSINDSLTDDSVDDKSGFFSGFSSDDHGLSSIITIPLNTIQQLTNSSCVPLSVPIPFTNSNINLPCMTQVYETHIPTIYNIWQVVSFGIIAYFICIDIFRIVKGFKDPQEDKVEVLDL